MLLVIWGFKAGLIFSHYAPDGDVQKEKSKQYIKMNIQVPILHKSTPVLISYQSTIYLEIQRTL